MNTRMPVILFALYLVEFAVLAVHPTSRPLWILENLTVLCIVVPLVWLHRRGIRFSNPAYLLMAVLIGLHTLAAHYTFSEVPFGWITDRIGAERNHFDRLVHFSVGFYAYAICEFIESRRYSARRGFSILFAVAAILAVAALFEIVEWLYVAIASPTADTDFLGAQGDIWDTQKDMLADGLGAIFAVLVYHFAHRGKFPEPRLAAAGGNS
jgi:putative membrane protein